MTVTDPAHSATSEGLNFHLGEELSLVRDEAKKFADDVLLPLATKHDREEKIDESVYRQIGELGFWGLTVPEQYGGAGLNNQALAVVLEELNRALSLIHI